MWHVAGGAPGHYFIGGGDTEDGVAGGELCLGCEAGRNEARHVSQDTNANVRLG